MTLPHYADNPLTPLPPCNPGGSTGRLLWGTGFEEFWYLNTFHYEDWNGYFLRTPYWRATTGWDAPAKTGLVHLELGYAYDPRSYLAKWLGQGCPTTAVHCHARAFALTAIAFPLLVWYDGTPTRCIDADWAGAIAEGELTAQASLWCQPDGTLELRRGLDVAGVDVLWTSATPILRPSPDEATFPADPEGRDWWEHLQARLTVHATAGTFELWHNRTRVVALTGLNTQVTGAAQATVIAVGSPVDLDPFGLLPDPTWFVDLDNVAITDGALLGEVTFERLTITGEVATTGFPWAIATAPTYGFAIDDPKPTVWESVADPIITTWDGTTYRPWEFGDNGGSLQYVIVDTPGLATGRFPLSDAVADPRPDVQTLGLWAIVSARRRPPDTLGGVPDGIGSIETRLAFGTALTYYAGSPHELEMLGDADLTLTTPTDKFVSGQWVADTRHSYRDWWPVNPVTDAPWVDADLTDLALEVHSGDPVTEVGYGLVLLVRTVLNPSATQDVGFYVHHAGAWQQVPEAHVYHEGLWKQIRAMYQYEGTTWRPVTTDPCV